MLNIKIKSFCCFVKIFVIFRKHNNMASSGSWFFNFNIGILFFQRIWIKLVFWKKIYIYIYIYFFFVLDLISFKNFLLSLNLKSNTFSVVSTSAIYCIVNNSVYNILAVMMHSILYGCIEIFFTHIFFKKRLMFFLQLNKWIMAFHIKLSFNMNNLGENVELWRTQYCTI